MITASFDRFLNKVQLQDDLPPVNFEGFVELPGVAPGDVFDVLAISFRLLLQGGQGCGFPTLSYSYSFI